MLTRLEADGFKNLLNFSINFGAFTCIAGPNAVGKSNVFDAIKFLSLLTEHTLMDAALKVRGADTATANLEELFWTDGQHRARSFRLAVEIIVPLEVEDDFGRVVTPTSTFLRYEVRVGYEPPHGLATLGNIKLLSEELVHITERDAPSKLKFPHKANRFRKSSILNRRRSPKGFISTRETGDGQAEILVHQDGAGGRPSSASASTAPRTIVGTSNTSATPTILAARREMQSWQILALEPSAMRGADRFHTDPHLTPNGAHMPATLYRLTQDELNELDVSTAVANRLSELVSVKNITVTRDDTRKLLTLGVEEQDGTTIPAMNLSDGTLRFLTLAVLDQDPEAIGVVCMEEPENGIHPAKMQAMVDLLYSLSIDTEEAPGVDNPMRQIIIASHSPVLVQLIQPEDLLCAMGTTVKGPRGKPTETLRCFPLVGTWRSRATDRTKSVGRGAIISYLTSPPDAKITLKNTTKP